LQIYLQNIYKSLFIKNDHGEVQAVITSFKNF